MNRLLCISKACFCFRNVGPWLKLIVDFKDVVAFVELHKKSGKAWIQLSIFFTRVDIMMLVVEVTKAMQQR